MDTRDIPNYLKRSFIFLDEFSWIFKESNTEIVAKEVLQKLPQEWADALEELSDADFGDLPNGWLAADLPADLRRFLETIQHLSIRKKCLIPRDPLKERIRGVSDKKAHEIEQLSQTIARQCGFVDVLVDLGCGLGYLSQFLNNRYGFKILGLECDEERVKSALARQIKYFPFSMSAVKFRCHHIDSFSMKYIKKVIFQEFKLRHPTIALIGLHTCGDLTAIALNVAIEDQQVRSLVTMPCCHHRMSLITENEFRYFPMSNTLGHVMNHEKVRGPMGTTNESPVSLPSATPSFHRPFLRLASQNTVTHWKKMSPEEHKVRGHRMLARSLAGALTTMGQKIRGISKFNCNTPITFDVLRAEYGLCEGDKTIPWTDEHSQRFAQISKKYAARGDFLAECLVGLQAALQEICENLVLLDKVQYAAETASLDSRQPSVCRLEQITDDEISPRCWALILGKPKVDFHGE